MITRTIKYGVCSSHCHAKPNYAILVIFYSHTLPSVNQNAYKKQTLRHINLLTMFPIFKVLVKFCILLTFQTNLTPYFSKFQWEFPQGFAKYFMSLRSRFFKVSPVRVWHTMYFWKWCMCEEVTKWNVSNIKLNISDCFIDISASIPTE